VNGNSPDPISGHAPDVTRTAKPPDPRSGCSAPGLGDLMRTRAALASLLGRPHLPPAWGPQPDQRSHTDSPAALARPRPGSEPAATSATCSRMDSLAAKRYTAQRLPHLDPSDLPGQRHQDHVSAL